MNLRQQIFENLVLKLTKQMKPDTIYTIHREPPVQALSSPLEQILCRRFLFGLDYKHIFPLAKQICLAIPLFIDQDGQAADGRTP